MTAIEKDIRDFAAQVARMTRLGDIETDQDGVEFPYQPDGCSDDDAQALYALIDKARVLVDTIREWDDEQSSPKGKALRDAAQGCHMLSEGDLEVDEDAIVSFGDDPGAYVAAWIWVAYEEAGLCRECGEPAPEGGDGFDGLCGNCADKSEKGEGC